MSIDGTGISALDTALVWGGAITILAGVLTIVWRAVRGVPHLGRRVHQVIDDWSGEEEGPGVPGRPGLMERVSGIEDRLRSVEHELYPNSGASLRDAVDLANDRLARLLPDEEEPAPPDASPTSS
ncbi:hypothetical protein [Streptomyces bicolor]|uniref:hypothetical protein n=1 Tax=Streptomyces bicolor TaxID=66874 RepID=UPI0007C45DA8|nr:hypothetical protein [Streptomyces bicolor]